MRLATAKLVALLCWTGCTKLAAKFVCQTDLQCQNGAIAWCEPTHFCSVESGSCPSGRRYIAYAGPYSNQCVESIAEMRGLMALYGTLMLEEDMSASGTLGADDPLGAPLTFSIVENGTKGTATLIDPTSGEYRYVPIANANGIDSFTFQVNDGIADSNLATVTVTIAPVDDPPVAVDGLLNLAAGTSGMLQASDIDSTGLRYSIVTNGQKGNATITDPATGAFTYAVNASESGTDTFTFKVTDGALDSNIATITVDISKWLWTSLLPAGGTQTASGLASDSAGNLYVTGSTNAALDGQGYGGGWDMFLMKLDRAGQKQWTRMRGGTGDDYGGHVILDEQGNIYVAGSSNAAIDGQPAAGASDIWLMKFDSSGAWQWTRSRGGAADDSVQGIGMWQGNIIALGRTSGAFDGETYSGAIDAAFVEWDPSGNWVASRIWGDSGLQSIFYGIVDPLGNRIEVGYTQPNNNTAAQIIVWDANRTFKWMRTRGDGLGLGGPLLGGIVADTSGDLYVSGVTSVGFDGQTVTSGTADMLLMKYDAAGNWQWTRIHGGTGAECNYPEPCSVAKVDSGLFVGGRTTAAFDGQTYGGGSFDWFVSKFDTAGAWQWTQLRGGTATEDAPAGDLYSDSIGNVFQVGASDTDALIVEWNGRF